MDGSTRFTGLIPVIVFYYRFHRFIRFFIQQWFSCPFSRLASGHAAGVPGYWPHRLKVGWNLVGTSVFWYLGTAQGQSWADFGELLIRGQLQLNSGTVVSTSDDLKHVPIINWTDPKMGTHIWKYGMCPAKIGIRFSRNLLQFKKKTIPVLRNSTLGRSSCWGDATGKNENQEAALSHHLGV